MVAVYVLTQKGYLSHPLFFELPDFLQNSFQISAPFPASHERHDTEGAHVVAAPHNRQKGSDTGGVPSNGCDVGIGLFSTEHDIHFPTFAFHSPTYEPGQVSVGIRAADDLDPCFKHFGFKSFGHAA